MSIEHAPLTKEQRTKKINELLSDSNRLLTTTSSRLNGRSEQLIIAFWKQLISNCNTALLLMREGFENEAMATTRLALENLFHLGALVKKPETLDKLINNLSKELRKQADAIHNDALSSSTLTKENASDLSDYLTATKEEKYQGASLHEMSKTAGLEFLYHSKYRSLSTSSAHSTLVAALQFDAPEDHQNEVLTFVEEMLSLSMALIDLLLKNSPPKPETK
ncbi:DUF5677 domain-containing protein [Pseudomonas sp. R32]|uniref:DUF5677 domain-containing protein n=1 Tax=Pseudomonas sp. R32 TaxID=1573704 RepID=UPI00132E8B7A|nr:DUF5677 domain-containing protein [Pseudomonas sp. R32]QHF29379.1 hypothetical protein PspR32_16855 [Pseudomonas sp. R32]